MITGGVASVIYGDPRFTRDLDVVLELHPPDVPSLVEAFQGEAYYLPPVEVMEEEAARSPAGHFNIIRRDTALRADVYVAGDDPLHAWGFERRQRIRFAELGMWVAPLEYVMLRKLQYFRASQSDRHLRDIAMMLRISGDLVDTDAMEAWLARLKLQDDYERARGFVLCPWAWLDSNYRPHAYQAWETGRAKTTNVRETGRTRRRPLHALLVSSQSDARSSRLIRTPRSIRKTTLPTLSQSGTPSRRGPSAARWLACSSPGLRVR